MDQMVLMFESIDTTKSGVLSCKDLSRFLLTLDKIRQCDFNLDRYLELGGALDFKLNASDGEKMKELEEKVSQLVTEFDLTGDKMIGPNEFFNIMMALYE